jgi:hypothetical protein
VGIVAIVRIVDGEFLGSGSGILFCDPGWLAILPRIRRPARGWRVAEGDPNARLASPALLDGRQRACAGRLAAW